jgi:predicted glycosyltransferase
MTSVALHSHRSSGMGHDRRSWSLVHAVRQGLKDEEVTHVTV